MSHRQRKQRRKRGHGKGRGVALMITAGIALAAIGVLSVTGYVIAIASTGPDLSQLKAQDKGSNSVIYAADGSRLGYVQADEIRTPITAAEMPDYMRNAVVAIEDERFYKHGGVDYNAIVRAGVKNLESGKSLQGGSTITQQLVRAIYIKDPERNFKRKIREAKLASELEKKHSKKWILENYLNDVPFGTLGGRTAIGVEAAAETFFNKHAKDLTLDEAALLAGLPQAPSEYNPFRNPAAALQRRAEVLGRMAKNGYITRTQARKAAKAPLKLRKGTRYTSRREPYFFDYVQDELIKKYGVGAYREGGLKVYTTINPKLQEAGRQAIAGQLNQSGDPSSAVVSIDPSNGYIRAMATSGQYSDRTFNLAAQGHRQPGSAFKTMVLTTAIRKGIDPDTTSYVSKPLSLDLPEYGHWDVKTYDNTYGGSMNLVRATLSSDNSVYAQLILDIGPDAVRDTAKLMGITSPLEGLPAEGLGGLKVGVSPLEMANAYATLASGGIRNKPKGIVKVVFPDGKSDDLGKPERKRVFTDGVAGEVTKILEQNVKGGTGTAANFGCPAAGKTGTTDNFNDAWFVGYTPKLSSSVWVGYPNALTEMSAVHGIAVAGGTFPAMIWHDYMNVAHGSDCGPFPQPTTPLQYTPFTGHYQSSSNDDTGTTDGYTQLTPSTDGNTETPDTGAKKKKYDPKLYEAPPQKVPKAPTAPVAPKAPPAGNGGGAAPGK